MRRRRGGARGGTALLLLLLPSLWLSLLLLLCRTGSTTALEIRPTSCATVPAAPGASTLHQAFVDHVELPVAPIDDLQRERERAEAHALSALFVERYLTLDQGDIVRLGGRGRSRSEGISIVRAMPLDDDDDDADTNGSRHRARGGVVYERPVLEDGALAFHPRRWELGVIGTCEPTLHTVVASNEGTRPLRLLDVAFAHGGFALTSEPRNAVLEPGESIRLEAHFVSGEPEVVDTHLLVSTTAGRFALPILGQSRLSAHRLQGLQMSLPVGVRFEHPLRLHNPTDRMIRVTEMYIRDGVGELALPASSSPAPNATASAPSTPTTDAPWDIHPQTTKTLGTFSFRASSPGQFDAAVRIHAGAREFVVPFRLDVLREAFAVEPSVADIGVFANDHEYRTVVLTFHNMGARPVAVRQLAIRDMHGLVLSGVFQGNPIIPPRARVRRAIEIQARGLGAGPCVARLILETNATMTHAHGNDPNDGGGSILEVALRGASTRGFLALPLREASMQLTAGVAPEPSLTTTPPFLSPAPAVGGASSLLQSLTLTNMFDQPIELEHVTLAPHCPEVTVDAYATGIAAPFENLPKITLRVMPSLVSSADVATRTCFVVVQTNVTTHRVPFYLFHGLVRVGASVPTSERGPPDACASLDEYMETLEALNTPASSTNDGDQSDEPRGRRPRPRPRLCRALLLDLGRVAINGSKDVTLNVTNVNPLDLHLHAASALPEDSSLTVANATTVFLDPRASTELVALGRAWRRRARHVPEDPVTASDHGTVVPPGHSRSWGLRFALGADAALGPRTEPLLVLETPAEALHVAVRYEAVAGDLVPIEPVVRVAPTHPGRAEVVHLYYRSSFQHPIATAGTTVSNALVHVWQTPPSLKPHESVSRVSVFLFPAHFYAACQSGRFYAHCFLDATTPAAATAPPVFSDFGALVTPSDLDELAKRVRLWADVAEFGPERHRLETTLTLHTDVLDAPPVTIVAPMARPRFVHAETLTFAPTEVAGHQELMVTVWNPCEYPMDMELTIAASDQELFYQCDEDMTEAECVREWQDIARERAQQQHELQQQQGHADPPNAVPGGRVAPFYIPARVQRVDIRGVAQLGPIYFFPSEVGEWHAPVFVRNELTHIERLEVVATSGRGALAVGIQRPEPDDGAKTEGLAALRSGDVLELRIAAPASPFGASETLVLANSGTFDVVIHDIFLRRKGVGAFELRLDGVRAQSVGKVVIGPGHRVPIEVLYATDCFHGRVENELILGSRDATYQFQLVGAMSKDTAFACRRAMYYPTAVRARLVGIAVVIGAVVAAALLLAVGKTLWVLWQFRQSHRAAAIVTAPARREAAAPSTTTTTLSTADELAVAYEEEARALDALQASLFEPQVGGMALPAVVAVLAERRQLESASATSSEQTDSEDEMDEALEATITTTTSITADTPPTSPLDNNQQDDTPGGPTLAEAANNVREEDATEPAEDSAKTLLVVVNPNDGCTTTAPPAVVASEVAKVGAKDDEPAEDSESGSSDDLGTEAPELEPPHEDAMSQLDDDWNDLLFASLQSEIGRLLVADDARSPPSSLPAVDAFVPARPPAPPGFTPADANPIANCAAFVRRRQPSLASSSTSSSSSSLHRFGLFDAPASGLHAAFSAPYSLFGPPRAPAPAQGREASDDASPEDDDALRWSRKSHLAALGGRELPSNERV